MHLFSIRQSNKVKKPIRLCKYNASLYHYNMTYEEVNALPRLAVAYYTNYENIEYPAIIHEPVFMVDDALKRLLKLYDEDVLFKGLHVYDECLDEENVQMHKYWAIGVQAYNCLHPHVRFYPNGSLEQLVLQQDKLPEKNIFKVGGIQEERIIISEAVVESILRRHMYGIEIEEIEIKK